MYHLAPLEGTQSLGMVGIVRITRKPRLGELLVNTLESWQSGGKIDLVPVQD